MDLQDICNTYTQVADRVNALYLKKKDKMRHLIFSVSKFQKSIMKRRFRFICKKYRFEIGHKICKARVFPRIRYVIDKNQFGYADFGDFFFWHDGGLYVWQENEKFAEDHNPDIVEDYFGESCDGRGYTLRSIFAGADTGYDENMGHRMFTGDIVMVKDPNGYEVGDLCLASVVDEQWKSFYGFPLDTLEQCKKDGYYLERIGTAFFQLNRCDEPVSIWSQALHYNNARCDDEDTKNRRIMAKHTPNFDKEVWKYLGIEIIGAEFDWDE